MNIITHHRIQSTLMSQSASLKDFTEVASQKTLLNYTSAVKLVNEQLQDPAKAVEDGTIVDILGFACYEVSIGY
jgi:hypothetical protein